MEYWNLQKLVELYFKTRATVLTEQAFRRKSQQRDAPSKHSILRYVESFRDKGSVAPKKYTRTQTVRTTEDIAAMSTTIKRSPNKSVRRLSPVWFKRILPNDWNQFWYKVQIVQSLKGDPRERLQLCNNLSISRWGDTSWPARWPNSPRYLPMGLPQE